eukprot:6190112-Pleurochrysis_carterae.AAC.2
MKSSSGGPSSASSALCSSPILERSQMLSRRSRLSGACIHREWSTRALTVSEQGANMHVTHYAGSMRCDRTGTNFSAIPLRTPNESSESRLGCSSCSRKTAHKNRLAWQTRGSPRYEEPIGPATANSSSEYTRVMRSGENTGSSVRMRYSSWCRKWRGLS